MFVNKYVKVIKQNKGIGFKSKKQQENLIKLYMIYKIAGRYLQVKLKKIF